MINSKSKALKKRRRSDICKICHKEYQKTDLARLRYKQREARRKYEKSHSDFLFYLGRKISHLKKRAKELNCSFDIKKDDLLFIWEQQKGLCYYTDIPMTWNTGSRTVVSVDRLIPEKGYIKTNIVLCCFIVNATKQERTEKEFYDFCKLILQKAHNRDM